MSAHLNRVFNQARDALDTITGDPFDRADALCSLADLIFYTYDFYTYEKDNSASSGGLDDSESPHSPCASDKSYDSDDGHSEKRTNGPRSQDTRPRIDKRSAVKDLKTAIQMLQEALRLDSGECPLSYTLSLYRCYRLLYKYSRRPDALTKGKLLIRKLIDVTSVGDFRSNLEVLVHNSDVDQSAVKDDSDEQAGYQSDDISDIVTPASPRTSVFADTRTWSEETLNSIQEGLEHIPMTRSDRIGLLQHLSGYLARHHLARHTIDKLEELINTRREPARDLRDQAEHAMCLRELTELIHLWFMAAIEEEDEEDAQQRTIHYLDEAIQLAEEALLVLPKESPHEADWLHDIAGFFHSRYQALESIDDLDRAIVAARRAVNAASRSATAPFQFSYAAGSLLYIRWCRSRASDDLNDAISFFQSAVKGMSKPGERKKDQVQYALYMTTLFNCTMARFEATEQRNGVKAALLEYFANDTVRLKVKSKMKVTSLVRRYKAAASGCLALIFTSSYSQ